MGNSKLHTIKRALSNHKKDLAIVVGNGVNRYNNEKALSWENLLLKLWKTCTGNDIEINWDGISYTEFYDMLECQIGSKKDIKNEVAKIINEYETTDYHRALCLKLIKWDVPLLTTNFDHNLEQGFRRRVLRDKVGFSYYYPWNVCYRPPSLSSPLDGFGVWHINGMAKYIDSIRLGLTDYISLASRVRKNIHCTDSYDDFGLLNQDDWKFSETWLNIFFHKSLCIFGLELNENEYFLRWLLIERNKYYKKYPQLKKKGWYVYCDIKGIPEGKKWFLEKNGISLVALSDYKEIYEDLLDVKYTKDK